MPDFFGDQRRSGFRPPWTGSIQGRSWCIGWRLVVKHRLDVLGHLSFERRGLAEIPLLLRRLAAQVVTGHGGSGLRRKSNHPLMSKVIMLHGSMIMEIKGDKLTGKMIDVHGAEQDTFVIEKGGKVTRTIVENPRMPVLIEPNPKKSKPLSMPKKYGNVIARGATWHYLAGAKLHPVKGWTSAPFDVSDWKQGPAGFGYGDKDDKTELEMRNNYKSVYIRKEFTL